MTHIEALNLALEALEESKTTNDTMEFHNRKNKAITAVKKALAQPEQGPVATVIKCGVNRTWMSEALGQLPDGTYSLYTAPPKRTWVGLTDEEVINVMPDDDTPMSLGKAFSKFAELIEAKLKEKNT